MYYKLLQQVSSYAYLHWQVTLMYVEGLIILTA